MPRRAEDREAFLAKVREDAMNAPPLTPQQQAVIRLAFAGAFDRQTDSDQPAQSTDQGS